MVAAKVSWLDHRPVRTGSPERPSQCLGTSGAIFPTAHRSATDVPMILQLRGQRWLCGRHDTRFRPATSFPPAAAPT